MQLPCVVRYKVNPHGGCVLGNSYSGATGAGENSSETTEDTTSSRLALLHTLNEFDVAFTGEKKRTMFFDLVLVLGVWKMVLTVSNFDTKNVFSVGVIRPADVENVLKGIIGQKPNTGLGLHLWSDCASIDNNDASTTTVSPDYRGIDSALIAVEVDMDRRLLHFSNGGKHIPYTITRLPSSLHFGFSSSCAQHVVRFVSLEKITAFTVDGTAFEMLEWMNILK